MYFIVKPFDSAHGEHQAALALNFGQVLQIPSKH